MCGFVGIANKNGRHVDKMLLTDMAETISHRGPDGEGCYISGNLGFYHKRLSIIDLETGQQPMSEDGLTIVFNGEIYNYIELRNTLKKRGYMFQTRSDTEVILKLYIEHGPDFVDHLNGMFAFLLYDQRRKTLLAVRDRLGIKPLYYTVNKEAILFASEIKALLRHPDVESAVDDNGIQDYLTFQYVLGEGTLFKNIRKVLPGHYLKVDMHNCSVHKHQYWKLDFTVDQNHTETYYINTLKKLLQDSVRIQMRSDVPLGAHLSGGLDSSLVTMLAARQYPGTLKTFTGAFREGRHFDETEYADSVVHACQAEGHTIYPTEEEFIDCLPKLIYHMDEPVAGPGVFPQYIVSRHASQNVKVVLGGQGGDEIFGGYARYLLAYFEQALKGAINGTNEEGSHIVSLRSIIPNLHYLRQYVPMMSTFWEEELFTPMDRRYFRLVDRSGGDLSQMSLDFRSEYDQTAIFKRFQRIFNNGGTRSYLNKMLHYDITTSLPGLLHVEDRVSMAVSLESRVPLLDHRIVEMIASMPPAMKFKGGEPKYIFKRAIKDILPAKVYHRKDKMGFPVPLHIWARKKARAFFQDILLSSSSRTRGLFDIKRVEALIDNEKAFGRKLWGLLNLELWFREFIDSSQRKEVSTINVSKHADTNLLGNSTFPDYQVSSRAISN